MDPNSPFSSPAQLQAGREAAQGLGSLRELAWRPALALPHAPCVALSESLTLPERQVLEPEHWGHDDHANPTRLCATVTGLPFVLDPQVAGAA